MEAAEASDADLNPLLDQQSQPAGGLPGAVEPVQGPATAATGQGMVETERDRLIRLVCLQMACSPHHIWWSLFSCNA